MGKPPKNDPADPNTRKGRAGGDSKVLSKLANAQGRLTKAEAKEAKAGKKGGR
jgi:hypothetical protein